MPQQCEPLPHAPLWCVLRGHFAFASCGILRTSCRLSRHAKTCPRSSATPAPLLLLLPPRYCFLRHFLQAKAAQSFARTHAHRIAVVLHFSLRQLAAKVAAFHFFSFLPYLPHSTPPTRSQLGLVIHTKRHELVVVTVVVVATVVAVVSVAVAAVAADFLLACMRLVCNLIATRRCLGL